MTAMMTDERRFTIATIDPSQLERRESRTELPIGARHAEVRAGNLCACGCARCIGTTSRSRSSSSSALRVAAKIDSSDAPLIGLAFGAGMEGENVGVFRAAVVAGRSGEIIEFLSVDDTVVTAGEAVGVFGVIESPGSFVLATRLGFERGDTFTPLDDEIADDLG